MGQDKNRRNPDGSYKYIKGSGYKNSQGFEYLGQYVEFDEQLGGFRSTGVPLLKASKRFKKLFYKGE